MNKAILLALAMCASLAAAPCTSAPLSAYTSAGFNCTIDQFTFMDFYFGVGAYSTGYTPIGASAITVAPTLTYSGGAAILGVGFSSGGFSVTGTDFVNYEIRYNIDPPPDIIIGTEDQLDTNSPVAPGFVKVDTNVCIGGKWLALLALQCDTPGTVQTLKVYHNGTPTGTIQRTDSITFPGVHILGIDNYITLNARGASADFLGVGNVTTAAPEPAAMALVLAGLLLMGARRLRSKVG